MQLIALTIEQVRAELGKPTPDLYLVIAKHLVVGMGAAAIAEVLGVGAEEIADIELDAEFIEVRLLVANAYAAAQSDSDIGWDGIEQAALKNLTEVVGYNKDPELNLKIAAVANKASRRHTQFNKPLDASTGGRRIVKLTLTTRTIRQLAAAPTPALSAPVESQAPIGLEAVEETREIVVHEPAASNSPSFEEIDTMLGVTQSSQLGMIDSSTIVEGVRNG